MQGILILIGVLIVLAILAAIEPIIIFFGYVVLAIMAGVFLWFLCVWIYHLTPKYKEKMRLEEDRRWREAEQRKRDAEIARQNRLKRERQKEDMEVLRFCIALWRLDFDKVIVDTNVFMNAAETAGTSEETRLLATCFFTMVRKLNLKICVLQSQLNELSNIKRKRDVGNEKQQKARLAVKLMHELQNDRLLERIGSANDRQSYADPVIGRVTRKLLKEGHRPLVITDDIGLCLDIGFEGLSLRKTLKELYELGADNTIHIRGMHCGGMFVCMDKNRGGQLVANRDRANLWESFSLFVDDQWHFTLQSKANNKFVCADPTQGGRLVAREATSDDQTAFEFELVPVAGKKSCIALKSKATGKFVSVRENEGNVLIANAPEVSDWEILEIC